MALFFVTYDLVKEPDSSDYKPLYDLLRSWGAERVLNSVWALDSDRSARQIRDELTRKVLDRNDRILVVQEKDWAGRGLLSDPNAF